MRIFLYEFVTGGGWYSHSDQSPPESLLAEGSAMLRSLTEDFAALDDVEIVLTRDCRYRVDSLPSCTIHEVAGRDDERRVFSELAAAADWSLIVAPEFSGHLHERCQWVERAGGRLLGPSSQLVALTADKHATAEHLERAGVSVPPGLALAPGDQLPSDFDYPAVLKPRDGAGSQNMELLWFPPVKRTTDGAMRLERLQTGTPASVACLCGPEKIACLQPCLQWIDADGHFAYQGGALPLPDALAERAARLATRAIATLEGRLGYLGVDLILGDDASGADDVVIEINPRVTTSYVGLRALFDGNLAAAMLAIAAGQQVELCWQAGSIQFEAAGAVRRYADQVVL